MCSCDRFKWTGCTFKKNKVTKLPRLCAFKPKFAHNRQGSNKLEVWVGNRGRQGRLPSACHLATPDSDRDKADNHLNTQLTCWRRNENPRPHCKARSACVVMCPRQRGKHKSVEEKGETDTHTPASTFVHQTDRLHQTGGEERVVLVKQ